MQREHALCKHKRRHSPFQVGDIVTFSFQAGGTRPCRIEEMKGAFARCGPPTRQGPTIGGRKYLEEWVNVAVVEWVMRVREQR